MKNKNNTPKTDALLEKSAPVKTAKTTKTADLENAPKKSASLSRLDFLVSNALKFSDIKPNDRILFNDKMHADAKKIDNKCKYAFIIAIDPKTKNILAVVDSAPYVFDRAICEKMAFTFARAEHEKNAPENAKFENVKLSARNLTHKNTVTYFAPFMTNKMIVDFMTKNKLATTNAK